MKVSVSHAIGHEVRKLLVHTLWYSAEPLTADVFWRGYCPHGTITVMTVKYHASQLALNGIIRICGERFVLAGPHSGDAVRLLRLAGAN